MREISQRCVVRPSCHPSAHLFADFSVHMSVYLVAHFYCLCCRVCANYPTKNSDSLAKGEKVKRKRKASAKARIVKCFP